MLHIIKSVQALNDAVNACSKEDELLLIEDAVYAANPQHHAYPLLDGHCCSVLKPDLDARAMINRVSAQLEIVDYNGFVSMTVKHPQSLTWN
ncbi:sulfurtransferase complex subunit TusB [Vibrio sp. NH-7]